MSEEEEEELWRELAEWDWLTTQTGHLLHAPADITYGDWAGSGTVACGRTFKRLLVPGMFTRMGEDRCPRCCNALGFPQGRGSPKNDDACRPLVQLRIQALNEQPTIATEW